MGLEFLFIRKSVVAKNEFTCYIKIQINLTRKFWLDWRQ